MAGIQRVVINQPGLRPGQPGAQITVPLSTLQVLNLKYWFPFPPCTIDESSTWIFDSFWYRHFRLVKEFLLVSLVISWSRQKLANIR